MSLEEKVRALIQAGGIAESYISAHANNLASQCRGERNIACDQALHELREALEGLRDFPSVKEDDDGR